MTSLGRFYFAFMLHLLSCSSFPLSDSLWRPLRGDPNMNNTNSKIIKLKVFNPNDKVNKKFNAKLSTLLKYQKEANF